MKRNDWKKRFRIRSRLQRTKKARGAANWENKIPRQRGWKEGKQAESSNVSKGIRQGWANLCEFSLYFSCLFFPVSVSFSTTPPHSLPLHSLDALLYKQPGRCAPPRNPPLETGPRYKEKYLHKVKAAAADPYKSLKCIFQEIHKTRRDKTRV